MEQHKAWLCHVKMTLADGSVAEDTRTLEKPTKLVVGDKSLSPAFEAQLQTIQAGQTMTFRLAPEDAFGPVQASQVHYMDRTRFDQSVALKKGLIMMFSQPSGHEVPGMIRDIVGDSVTVDFNHPLAGQTIDFEIECLEALQS